MDSMIRRYFIYLAALLSVVAGCDGGVEIDMPDVSGHEIEASLNISAEPMPSGTPLSKAGFIDQSEESVEVRDLWVLQFDGTDESKAAHIHCREYHHHCREYGGSGCGTGALPHFGKRCGCRQDRDR